MSSDRAKAFQQDLHKIITSDEYRGDIAQASKETLEKLREHTAEYLNDTGKRELEIKAARLLRAKAKLESMTDPDDIAHQKKIIAGITRIYELRFTANQVAKAVAVSNAQKEVVALLKKAGTDFAQVAAKVAIKHGIAALKESL